MKLIDIVKKAQRGSGEEQENYKKRLYNKYKEFLIKQFIIFSPYNDKEKTKRFVSQISLKFYFFIQKKFNSFKLKKSYSQEELDEHLWNYFHRVAESILDKSLIDLYFNSDDSQLKNKIYILLKEKYKEYIYNHFFNGIKHSETIENERLNGYELEEYWEKETEELLIKFYLKKFEKLLIYFDKNNSNSIFSNYLDKSVKNYFADYLKGKSVQKMRRLIIYHSDLPENLFETLKDIKGYGNLFYYKKKSDCLSVRNVKKALAVIGEFNLPDKTMNLIRNIFNQSQKRAQYQRIIDNILKFIEKLCPDNSCNDKLSSFVIKTLLSVNDVIMKNKLALTENDINQANIKLKKCVECLKIDKNDIFLS